MKGPLVTAPNRLALPFCILLALALPAHADGLEPGFWKVTSQAEVNGNPAPPSESMRCLTPADTADLKKTFSPQMRTQRVACEQLKDEFTPTTLAWHMKCTGEPMMDVAGAFKFETPQRYTAMIVTKATIGPTEMNSRVAIIGERVGDCP
jgi:hypothetical protein